MTSEIAQFSKDLAVCGTAFASVLPAHISPEKFMRTVVGAVQNNPDILRTDRTSLYSACQKAAQDGLLLDGRDAAIVAFKNKATYMPMVAGLLKKLRNSGQISTIIAQTVHEADAFSYNPARDTVPNHEPDWFGSRGAMIGVYAVAQMKDGGTVVELMSLEQINKVKSVSRTPGGPWTAWPEEMAKKTVLRRISKYLPSSADIDQVFAHDNDNFDLSSEPTQAAPKGKTRAEEKIESYAVDGEVVDAEVVEEEDTVVI
jgi:recombination protein RecT